MRDRLVETLGWLILVPVTAFLLFVVASWEGSSSKGVIVDSFYQIEELDSSRLYIVKEVFPLEGKYYVRYTTRRSGILFWEREGYEKERIRLGLPSR